MTIRPLTRRNRGGEPYRRTERVEQQIGEALTLESAELVERARIRDHRAVGHLADECLVYLIREYHQRGRCDVVDDLSAVLMGRASVIVKDQLRALGPELAGEAFADVVAELFPPIVDLDSDAGDFLQVRFRVRVERLATSAFRHRLPQAKRANRTVPLSALAGNEAESRVEQGTGASAASSISLDDQIDLDVQDVLEDAVVVRDELLRTQEGLALLKGPHLIAFILRHYASWPIEHSDPTVPTIGGYLGRDPRTIRNWLKQAQQTLEAWRGAST